MHTLRVLVNDKELLSTESPSVAWLRWDLIACIHESHYAGLSVSGSIEVAEGNYDMLDWLHFYPLREADIVEIQVLSEPGHTPFVGRRTPAEQEALRQECLAAEASGELDAARIGPRRQYRTSCSLYFETPCHPPLKVASTDAIDTVTCSGMWSAGHKPDQWRLRVATVPGKEVPGASSTAYWCRVDGAARIQLGA